MKPKTESFSLLHPAGVPCWRLMGGLAVLMGGLLTTPVWAADPAASGAEPDWAAEQFSVRELMRMETHQALREARQRARPADDEQSLARHDSAVDTVRPVLAAIYGVGPRLTAEIRWGERLYRFRHGQAHEMVAGSRRQSYVLQAFRPPCIALDHEGQALQLCLADPAGRTGQVEGEAQ